MVKLQKFLTLFIGIGAVMGAAMMWIDPSGQMWGMEPLLEMLRAKMPWPDVFFKNFIPSSFVLLFLNGFTQFVAAVLFYKKHPLAYWAVFACGLILMLWIVLEWWVWGFNFMSNIYFVFGLIEAVSAIVILRKKKVKLIDIARDHARRVYLKLLRKKLKNKEVCVIASNCNGAYILHDLGLRFNSPFVNLWMKPKDFIKMLKNIEYYMSCKLVFIKVDGIDYPVGMLDDVHIYFQHYRTEFEAKSKWEERVARLEYSNLFIMFTDRDGCTEADLKEYDQLPYENKVVFVHKQYPEIKSAFYIKGFENESSVGICSNYKSSYSWKKYYDDFEYVKWFNSNRKEKHKNDKKVIKK